MLSLFGLLCTCLWLASTVMERHKVCLKFSVVCTNKTGHDNAIWLMCACGKQEAAISDTLRLLLSAPFFLRPLMFLWLNLWKWNFAPLHSRWPLSQDVLSTIAQPNGKFIQSIMREYSYINANNCPNLVIIQFTQHAFLSAPDQLMNFLARIDNRIKMN